MWNKADKIIGAIGSFTSIASVSMVSILGILQVFFRFVFHINAPWTEELMRALYIYVVFFGLILVEKENSEIRTTMLIEKLPPKLYNVWEVIVSLTSIFFNILVLIGSFIAYGTTNSTLGALPTVSMRIFFIPMIISLPLMIVYQVYYMVKYFHALRTGEKKEDEA